MESLEGTPGEAGLVWTNVVEADSGRRLRLDFEMVKLAEPVEVEWEHRLEGTAFGVHLVRQATMLRISPDSLGAKVEATLSGELKGAAKLAGPSLKSDQKKLLESALGQLKQCLEAEG